MQWKLNSAWQVILEMTKYSLFILEPSSMTTATSADLETFYFSEVLMTSLS